MKTPSLSSPSDLVSSDPGNETALIDQSPIAAPAITAVTLWKTWKTIWQDRHVLVLGLGASGLSMARWFAQAGALVTVADTRTAPPYQAALQEACPQTQLVAGAFSEALLDQAAFDVILRSPGLSPREIDVVVQAAESKGIPVFGELEVFSQALQSLQGAVGYSPKVLAVTGTNGKTTVTSLTSQLLERSGLTVAVAGNIGPPLLETLAQACLSSDPEAELTLPQAWVLELSSFQLDGVRSFEPMAAVCLNITQDHLDWHGDMHAYSTAKAMIFGTRGLTIKNRDDAVVMALQPPQISLDRATRSRTKSQQVHRRPQVTFGSDVPLQPGDFGLEMVAGMPWLVRAHEIEVLHKRGRNAELETHEIHLQRLMPADALRIRGRHNASNALAALALASAAGARLAPMLYGLREYQGEPHRVDPIGFLQGVEFFDDSKGTNVGATVAALHGLGADRKVVVILGGDGKGQDFSPLKDPIAVYARAAVLIGRDAAVIESAVAGNSVKTLRASDMGHAVYLAFKQAQEGDAVLLSPACASLDMYRNYEHRAQVFIEAVRELAEEHGQVLEGGK